MLNFTGVNERCRDPFMQPPPPPSTRYVTKEEWKATTTTGSEVVVMPDVRRRGGYVSAILNHQFVVLTAFVDVATTFSCKVLKADVKAFDLMDSDDGHTSKVEVRVTGDMRVLLNGSKLVGKDKIPSFLRILKVHGYMREQSKLVHSKMRVELNSGHKLGGNEVGSEHVVCTTLLPLAVALRELGECSFARAQKNLGSIGSDDLKGPY